MLSPVIYVFFFTKNIINMARQQAISHLVIFAVLNGLSLGSIFLIYTNASIAKTFFATASTFGTMSLWLYYKKRFNCSYIFFIWD